MSIEFGESLLDVGPQTPDVSGSVIATSSWRGGPASALRPRGVIAARCRLGADTHAELLEADARRRAMDVADA